MRGSVGGSLQAIEMIDCCTGGDGGAVRYWDNWSAASQGRKCRCCRDKGSNTRCSTFTIAPPRLSPYDADMRLLLLLFVVPSGRPTTPTPSCGATWRPPI